jgi:chemotaxis protein MotB
MARKKKNMDEGSNVDIGVVMTCSLFLIILTFFILLNSIAVIDDKKQRLAIGSLVGSFGSLSGGLSALNTGSSIMPASSPVVKQELDFHKFLNALDVKVLGRAKIVVKKGQGVITINTMKLFGETIESIEPSKSVLLDELISYINGGIYPLEIVGHTDNRPAEVKGYGSNWELTSLMAIRVLRYFVDKGGVHPDRITAYGVGSQHPIASNETAETRGLNNRVDIILKFSMPDHVQRIYSDRSTGNFTYKRFNFKVF